MLIPPRSMPFTGRQQELASLLASLEAAGHDRGRVVLIAGEPGVGKTRLLQELAAGARVRGSRVLTGRAYESQGMPPYLPLIEALRDYVDACADEPLRAQLGPDAAQVGLLLPAVGARLGGLPADLALSPELQRYRLFESVCDFVLRIARGSPGGLLLCLDDLHWADAPTLLLLLHLARRVAGAPMLVVGTYRTADLDYDHRLPNVLAELSREGLCERITLPVLSAEETATLIQGMTNGPAAPEVSRRSIGRPRATRSLSPRWCASSGPMAATWPMRGR